MPTRYPTQREPLRRPGAAGIVGGIVAASVMLMVATVVSATQGASGLEPVRLIGATFLGERALTSPGLSSVLGLLTHIVMGSFFGWLFGVGTRRLRSAPLMIAAGLLYGTVIFFVMTLFVLPWADPMMAEAVQPGWFFVYHLTFGLLLPVTLLVARQKLTRQWFGDGREVVTRGDGDMVRPRP